MRRCFLSETRIFIRLKKYHISSAFCHLTDIYKLSFHLPACRNNDYEYLVWHSAVQSEHSNQMARAVPLSFRSYAASRFPMDRPRMKSPKSPTPSANHYGVFTKTRKLTKNHRRRTAGPTRRVRVREMVV
jgi:hypothetical protein